MNPGFSRLANRLVSLLLGSAVLAVPCAAEDSVRDAALATYVHGITDEIAKREIGAKNLQELYALLFDPDFPRRDNVVGFLGFLGDAETTKQLLTFLDRPPVPPSTPEEDRALLLAPQVLGMIAARGERAALQALLDMTSHGSGGGLLEAAAREGGKPGALRDDLLEMALRGLAYSRSPEARRRLIDVSEGRVEPAPGGRDLVRAARGALELLTSLPDRGADGESETPTDRAADGGTENLTARTADGSPAPSKDPGAPSPPSVDPTDARDEPGRDADASILSIDTEPRVQDHGLTYANHVDLASPMTDTALDDILRDASLRMGRADLLGDVACCTTVNRSGTARTFGVPDDGLDIINNADELDAVQYDATARVKVVRAINYCARPGVNIVGCSPRPGAGMVLVQIGGTGHEAVLWSHEYGHNLGLTHVLDALYIMYPIDNGSNVGLYDFECYAFHAPPPQAGALASDAGLCADTDADEVQDRIDDCPGTPNKDQIDADADGAGRACDCDDSDPNVHLLDDDCDGTDENCSGTADEGYVGQETHCGVGGCSATGVTSCAGGQTRDGCVPGPSAPEVCNGLDDDCDGVVDEEACFLPSAPPSAAALPPAPPPTFTWFAGGFWKFRVVFASSPDLLDRINGSKFKRATKYTPSTGKWKKIKQRGSQGKPIYWLVEARAKGSKYVTTTAPITFTVSEY